MNYHGTIRIISILVFLQNSAQRSQRMFYLRRFGIYFFIACVLISIIGFESSDIKESAEAYGFLALLPIEELKHSFSYPTV